MEGDLVTYRLGSVEPSMVNVPLDIVRKKWVRLPGTVGSKMRDAKLGARVSA